MLFQLHQYTKKALQQWRQSYKFLLICYNAHLSIDVHCSRHLKKDRCALQQTYKKNKKQKIIQPPIKIIQRTLFFFISFILSHHALSHHHSQAQFSYQALIFLICQALISLIKLSSPSPRCRHPSPRLSPRRPSQSTLGQCSLFFCSEFFSSGCLLFWLNFSGFGVILW